MLSREASTLRDAKGAKLKESDVLEKVEKVCDPEAVEGEWPSRTISGRRIERRWCS